MFRGDIGISLWKLKNEELRPRCLFRATFLLLSILPIRNIRLRPGSKMLLGSQEKVKTFQEGTGNLGKVLVGVHKDPGRHLALV